MATKRKSLSKKTRFEVFKRDSFKCQYCGASAPEAILVVDHIDPISKDGADEITNYITACQPCNAGKSDRKLDDSTAVQKQKAQLDELNQRREQLEMMLQWRSGLKDIKAQEVDAACEAWAEGAPGWHLNDTGRASMERYVKKHGLSKVLDAIEEARIAYIKPDENGSISKESVDLALHKVGGFLRMGALPADERRLYYIKGILRNRMGYIPFDVMSHLGGALARGVPVEAMEDESKHARSWSAFRTWLYEFEVDD